MPRNNRFQHQQYQCDPRTSDVQLLQPRTPPAVPLEDYRRRMQAVGDAYRRADVRAIYLVHGTFVGADALGIIREIARVSRTAGARLRRLQKQLADSITDDAGNYTVEFAEEFASRINVGGGRQIPVRLFSWSSENLHIGRADGAVHLIDELASREELRGGRVLLWGHSHGGNVFALVTNLLQADAATQHRFFHAARSYFRWPLAGKVDLPVWTRVRELLARHDNPLAELALDMVTFGTPVRYGWEVNGRANLLHLVNHRPIPGKPVGRAVFPPEIDDLLSARYGDYVQQLGIAGTNFTPAAWSWRAWLAEVRLGRLLQAGIRKRDLLTRLKAGIRAHEDGTTLLVDYGPAEGHVGQHYVGHAIYTRLEWLLFHAEEVARRFYQLTASTSPEDLEQ